MSREHIQTFSLVQSPTFNAASSLNIQLIHPNAQAIIDNVSSVAATATAGTGEVTVTAVSHGLERGDLFTATAGSPLDIVTASRVSRVIDSDTFMVKSQLDLSSIDTIYRKVAGIYAVAEMHFGSLDLGDLNTPDFPFSASIVVDGETYWSRSYNTQGEVLIKDWANLTIGESRFMPLPALTATLQFSAAISGQVTYETRTTIQYTK
jgi:hypothetical protein